MKTKKALLALLLFFSVSVARAVTPISPQTESWAKSYAQMMIEYTNTQVSVGEQRVLGALEVTPDTMFFILLLRVTNP